MAVYRVCGHSALYLIALKENLLCVYIYKIVIIVISNAVAAFPEVAMYKQIL